ncbi:hypothetical protein CR513_42312, partial [Mucuna pruriens]
MRINEEGGKEFIENEMLGSEVGENPKENTMVLHISSVAGITSKKSLKLWGTTLEKKGAGCGIKLCVVGGIR